MDRDQENKFYQDDFDHQVDVHDIETTEPIDDMQYFLESLKHLHAVLDAGSRIPATNKKLVDANMCEKVLEDIEGNLPDAIQYGMQMYAERERILGTAEQKAANTVSSAEMRANAVMEKAKAEAERILSEAEEEARYMLSDAKERADHMVEENEIVVRAREEARILKNDAKVEASCSPTSARS